MLRNRSMPVAPVIPELVYEDVAAAAAWLCDAFGFTLRWRAGAHRAQLAGGEAGIAIAEPRGDERPPAGAARSHAVMIRVEDVDAHFERARARGARILDEPTDFPYGERQYNAEDPGGHRWTFSQTIADVDPADWGGA